MALTKEDKALLEDLMKQVERLAPFEKHFNNAKRNYLLLRPQTLGELLTARYGSDWRSQVGKQVTTCATCKLREILKIAMEYDSMKMTIAQLENQLKNKDKDEKK